ncbi:E3 ubiquitin-protein ligase DTX3L1 isoform X2 [Antennarius striatus]|uniref:E3 ubiquitin-protein ligase DTX3L1 isoform X2 n=1 Tax=Antennarius striatus TaxID=241820 RepID=UPI0035B1205D
MGSSQSTEKLHCNRYLNGQGPPSFVQQANEAVDGVYSAQNGCQPQGEMTWEILHRVLPAFPNSNTLQVNFTFTDGVQTEKHPHPGQPYTGLQISTFLPDNHDGRKLLKLLEKAFDRKLLFMISTNKDGKDVVTTKIIPLKIQPDGGSGQSQGSSFKGIPNLPFPGHINQL